VCVRKPYTAVVYREDGGGSDGGGGGNWRRQMVKLSPVFSSLTFPAGPFCFGVGKGGRVVVCDGSLRVPTRCGGCATLRVGRTLFSHTSHLCFLLSLSKCELRSMCVSVSVCVGVCVHPPPPPPLQIGFGVAFFPNSVNVLLAIPG